MHALQTELEHRWRKMFSTLAAGDDVSPTQRLRAEGLMEAAVLAGTAAPDTLVAAMAQCYRTAFGHDLSDDFGEDWQGFFPFPQIPAMARRAPVFPSTKD